MRVIFVYFAITKNLMRGKFAIQSILKHIGQSVFGLGNHTLIKFYLRLTFAVISHCFFAGLMDHIHRKFAELIDPRGHTLPPLLEKWGV